MLRLIMIFNFTCPQTVVLNRTEIWEKLDQQTLNRATGRCAEIYNDAPCLKVFNKIAERHYHAICGQPTEKVE